jgi:hypothetical protein
MKICSAMIWTMYSKIRTIETNYIQAERCGL